VHCGGYFDNNKATFINVLKLVFTITSHAGHGVERHILHNKLLFFSSYTKSGTASSVQSLCESRFILVPRVDSGLLFTPVVAQSH
jgi:hypothetical protein